MDSPQHCRDQAAECIRLVISAQSEAQAQVLRNPGSRAASAFRCSRRYCPTKCLRSWHVARTERQGRSVSERGWQREFDDPIPLPDGGQLRTLREAVAYLAKAIPKAGRTCRKF